MANTHDFVIKNGLQVNENSTVSADISLGDNNKLKFGAGSDLQIYHDGSHSYIDDAGTGDLRIRADNLLLKSASGEDYITATSNGGVSIAYDNATKLATTSTGIDVTGTIEIDTLSIGGTTVSATPAELNLLDGATVTTTEINYNDITSLGTVQASKTVTANSSGNVNFPDNSKAIFGAGSDLQIYHDGSNSYISEVGTGDLYVRGSNFYITKPDGSLYFSGSNSTGEAGVYFNNAKKLATTSTGVDITGNITVSGTVDGRDLATDGTKLDGIESGATADQTITAGSGLTGGGTGDVTLYHADTSSQASVDNSNGTVVQDITLDGYGHVTALGSVNLDGRYYTETEADSRFVNVTGDTMSGTLVVGQIDSGNPSAGTDDIRVSGYGILGNRATFYVTNPGTVQIGVGSVHNADPAMSFTSSQNTSHHTLYEGSNRVFTDGYHPNADKWTTARTLSLSGDASGSVSWDGSANATLSVTVADDSHSHSNYITSNANDTATGVIDFTGGSSTVPAIRIKSGGNNWSEGLAIHPSSDSGYALAFFRTKSSLTDSTNTWAIGNLGNNSTNNFGLLRNGLTGGSGIRVDSVFDVTQAGVFRFGFNPTVGSNAIWHAGNDGSGSGLDADLLDGVQLSGIVQRDFQDTGRNLNIATESTGSAGLFMKASDNSFRFQLYGDGTRYGFLYSDWGNWDLRKERGGVLYLNNNTSYYLDPAGTSVFSTLTLAGNSAQLSFDRADGAGQHFKFYEWASGLNIYASSAASTIYLGRDGYSTVLAAHNGDIRSPIFYDYNNTSYYVDPASTSNLDYTKVRGKHVVGEYESVKTWSNGTFSASTTQARRWTIGRIYFTPVHWGDWSNVQLVIQEHSYNQSEMVYNIWGWYGMGNGTSLNLDMVETRGWANADLRVSLGTVTSTGWTYSGGNVYYQDIYIDVDYYRAMDVIAKVSKSTITTSNPGSGTGFAYVFYDSPSVTNISAFQHSHFLKDRYYRENTDSFRAPIFYDSNNTSYYIHGDSLSNLYQLQVNNNNSTYMAIGASDDVRNGLGMYDTSSVAANIGGQLVLGYKYTGSTYTVGAIVKMYKETATDGQYGSGLKFQVRNHGEALGTRVWIDPTGNLFSDQSVRAPIFYDTNNTSYYVDPASTSNLVRTDIQELNVNGGSRQNTNDATVYITATTNNDWGLVVNKYNSSASEYGVDIRMGSTFNYGLRITNAGSTNFIVTNSQAQHNSSMRAPIFYDSNNTSYYVNPATGFYQYVGTYTGTFVTTDSSGGISVEGNSTGGPKVGIKSTASGGEDLWLISNNSGNAGGAGKLQFWNNSGGFTFAVFGTANTSDTTYIYCNLTASGNVTAYSDERLKENVVVIPNALDKVKAIRGVTFNRNDMEEKPRHAGVIAQEVEKVLPEVVSEDNKGIKTVAYGNMVGLLIEAIKELKDEVDDLKAQLAAK